MVVSISADIVRKTTTGTCWLAAWRLLKRGRGSTGPMAHAKLPKKGDLARNRTAGLVDEYGTDRPVAGQQPWLERCETAVAAVPGRLPCQIFRRKLGRSRRLHPGTEQGRFEPF